MRLLRFEVSGYKNLVRPIALEDLDRLVILHGDNNVGKSNLLEAVALCFALLKTLRFELLGHRDAAEEYQVGRAPPPGEDELHRALRSASWLAAQGFPLAEILPFGEPRTLRFGLSLQVEEAPGGRLDLHLTLQPVVERGELRAVDITLQCAQPIAAAMPIFAGPSSPLDQAVAVLRADRTTLGAQGPEAREEAGPLSPALALRLYEAELSESAADRARFQRFLRALAPFQRLLGEGQWVTRFDLRSRRAALIWKTARGPLALRQLGTGLQQAVGLLAWLCLAEESVLAIEEPELNLRYQNQRLLSESFRALIAPGGTTRQLFLTSHSPAFELEGDFFEICAGEGGPVARRRPAALARVYTLPEELRVAEGAQAPVSVVTTEGLVQLPDNVRQRLALEPGRGVVFVPEAEGPAWRMMTDAQFLALLGEAP